MMLQQCQTYIERWLAIGLFVNGLDDGLFAQYYISLDGYRTRADFVYDYLMNGCQVAIYCDGYPYHSSAQALVRDRKIDRDLQLKGWRVLRFMGTDLVKNLADCVKSIKEALT